MQVGQTGDFQDYLECTCDIPNRAGITQRIDHALTQTLLLGYRYVKDLSGIYSRLEAKTQVKALCRLPSFAGCPAGSSLLIVPAASYGSMPKQILIVDDDTL